MPEAHEAIVATLTQPDTLSSPTKYKPHRLDLLLEQAVDGHKLAMVVVGLAMKGQPWAIKMIYDRLAGLPVQRLEAKLLAAVQDDAARIAKEQGIDVTEVMAQAKKLASGT